MMWRIYGESWYTQSRARAISGRKREKRCVVLGSLRFRGRSPSGPVFVKQLVRMLSLKGWQKPFLKRKCLWATMSTWAYNQPGKVGKQIADMNGSTAARAHCHSSFRNNAKSWRKRVSTCSYQLRRRQEMSFFILTSYSCGTSQWLAALLVVQMLVEVHFTFM